MNDEAPLAISYIRFSTPEQAMGDSERRQWDEAKAYADANGLRLDPRYYADRGVSAFRGRNVQEGALREILREAQDGDLPEGTTLIVESMDRLSRDIPRLAVRVLEDLCLAGLTVVTLDNGSVYTAASLNREPYAFLMAYLVAIRANEEGLKKGRRVAAAWEAKRARASEEKLTAIAPKWLSLRDDRASFDIIPEKAETVRRIFAEALEGKGQEAIASGLNLDGVPTFGRGKMWHKSTVAKLLRSPAVIGQFQPHKIVETKGAKGQSDKERVPAGPLVDGYFPEVVDRETFARVQAGLIGKRASYVRRGQQITNPLAGIARCGNCGGSMTQVVKGKGSKPRLVCSRAKVAAGCEYRSVLVEDIWEALRDPRLLEDAPTGTEESRALWERLEREQRGQEEEVTNLTNAIARGGHSPALMQALAKAEAEQRRIDKALVEVRAKVAAETPQGVKRRLGELTACLEDPDIEAAALNQALRENVSSVTIYPAEPEQGLAASLAVKWLHGGETDAPIGGFG